LDEQEKQRLDSPERNSGNGSKRRSSRRRNRRRKGSGPDAAIQPPYQVEDQQTLAADEQEAIDRPRTGNAAKPKRRNAPRRASVPDANGPTEVVRATAPQIAPLQPMRLRKIDGTDNSEPMVGCPMLTRTRIGIPFRGNQRVARCSVGWAVHDEDEVLLCMHTPSAAQCWKEHPEQVEVLIERLRPQIEAELASGE
jgi:hypothetical protein